jgi:hypothetical protein
MPAVETLSRRALNRATLARQLLLERAELPVLDAVAHVGGLSALRTISVSALVGGDQLDREVTWIAQTHRLELTVSPFERDPQELGAGWVVPNGGCQVSR